MTSIMIIGGTDSSGGAGLTRDAFVARSLGCDVFPIVTAVTAQSNQRAYACQTMPTDLVRTQIEAALATAAPAAIKIGMLGTDEIAETIAETLQGQSCPIVLDPVLRSSSGGQLMSGQMPRSLLSLAHLITPNIPESAMLSGYPEARTDAEISRQADWFLSHGTKAVLIKGGHAAGSTAADHLFWNSERYAFQAPRLTATLRGTGCSLATAIACHLARKTPLPKACQTAKDLVHNWLREVAIHPVS